MAANNADPAASASYSSEPDFKLGDWWVRPQLNELDRSGETAHVEARSMGVLVCLARHAPRVVSRQRLLDEVWDSRFVGDEAISHAIWELRKVLGDSAREPVYIKTVPGKGYVLLAEIVRAHGSPLPIAGARIDHYDIREELGRGSMGVVFKAFDRRLERTVAIKFLAPELTRDHEACRRFQREAQLAAALDHPNLATVHAIGETSEGQHYLVTPFYAGGSLKAICARGDLTLDGAVRFARQLARGLAAAHAQGIVHRDIKPANLLIDEHGTLKIADFGIAKLLGATDLTRTGVSLGTPAYKSPEQARGHEVDHRSDIWSFGVVLFEMLTGRRPFDGEFEQAVVHAILTLHPVVERDPRGRPIPEPLRKIVTKAMAREPGERYQRAEEVERALDSMDGPAIHARVVAGRPGGRFGSRLSARQKRWCLVAGIALLVLLVGGFEAWRRSGTEPSPDLRLDLARAADDWLRGNDGRNLGRVRAQLSAVIDAAPHWADALGFYAVFLAECYAADKKPEDRARARELIARARAIDRDSPYAQVAEARLLLIDDPRSRERAREAAQAAVDRWPRCGRADDCDLAYATLADVLWMLDRRDEAIATAESGMREGKGRIRCRLKLASFHELSGEPERAILEYREVLRIEPGQSTALGELGNIYLELHRWDEASSTFQEAWVQTGDPRMLFNRGNALYYLRRWAEVRAMYREALGEYRRQGIREDLVLTALGDLHMELGESEEAREYYEAALGSLDEIVAGPDPALGALGRRAVCFAKLGRFDEARAAMKPLLPHQSSWPYILVHAARIEALAGDRDALFDFAERAVAEGRVPPFELRGDAAFIRFRTDEEYLAILEPGPARSR